MRCGLSAEDLMRNCSDSACHTIRVLVVGGVRLDELAAKAQAAELDPESATLPRGAAPAIKMPARSQKQMSVPLRIRLSG